MILDKQVRKYRLFTLSPAPTLPLTCRVSRFFKEKFKMLKYYVGVMGIVAVMVIAFMYWRKIENQREMIVGVLLNDVLEMVHEESENYRVDPIRQYFFFTFFYFYLF